MLPLKPLATPPEIQFLAVSASARMTVLTFVLFRNPAVTFMKRIGTSIKLAPR
jgi:hypothetical protein